MAGSNGRSHKEQMRRDYGDYQDHLDHIAVRGQNAAARKMERGGTLSNDVDYSEKDLSNFENTFGLNAEKQHLENVTKDAQGSQSRKRR